MSVRAVVLFVSVSLPVWSMAEESPVYESFDGITIGRVFLTQRERELLDVRRLQTPRQVERSNEQTSGAVQSETTRPSAGYIIGRDGRPKTWKDGDFVDSGSRSSSAMSFPGDVKITRHVSLADDDNDDSDQQ